MSVLRRLLQISTTERVEERKVQSYLESIKNFRGMSGELSINWDGNHIPVLSYDRHIQDLGFAAGALSIMLAGGNPNDAEKHNSLPVKVLTKSDNLFVVDIYNVETRKVIPLTKSNGEPLNTERHDIVLDRNNLELGAMMAVRQGIPEL